MSSHEILHQSSCAYTPRQNGVVERKNRHLVETARTLLLHHRVPQRFWGDAILAACYLINRMSSPVLHDQIPHSIIFPNQPLFCLPPHVFGCVCFVYILTPGQDKLSIKAIKCVFFGYSDFNDDITTTLLIHIDILSLPKSPFLRTFLCSLPPTHLVLMSYLYPFFIYSWIPHLYPRLLHLDHCKFILVTCGPSVDSSPMALSFTTPVLPSPVDLSIAV